MKPSLLKRLACPAPSEGHPSCGGELALAEPGPGRSLKDGDEIEAGTLRCGSCGAEYPIIETIPRLRPCRADDRKVAKTRAGFGWEWARYPGSLPEDRSIFLDETQLPPEQWDGKTALDAGCGMGRYTKVALSLGAEVVAFDLSDSILRLIPRARKDPKLHLVQGDLLSPPFRPDSFDIIYSQGVIHHTADTRGAFDRLADLVRTDGNLAVWVYGTPGSWASFSTNPLRMGREWIRSLLPLIWVLVWARQLISDTLRLLTTRLPVPVLYALCYPLTWLGRVPLLKFFTYSVHPDFTVRLIENFDWLSPPFQTKHTKEEIRDWFEAAGYKVLSHLPHGVVPKIGLLGKRLRP